jgi:hypothetical protein
MRDIEMIHPHPQKREIGFWLIAAFGSGLQNGFESLRVDTL